MAKALHQNCVGCRALHDGDTGEAASVALVAILVSKTMTLETFHATLCFKHRQQVDDTVSFLLESV